MAGMTDTFLKFLEENCPGDDAHDGAIEPNKPLLDRCGMCRSIYEAHLLAAADLVSKERARASAIAQEACICGGTAGCEGCWAANEILLRKDAPKA